MRIRRRTTIASVCVLATALAGGCKTAATTTTQSHPTAAVTVTGPTVGVSTAPAATPPAAGRTNCGLISQAEASAAAGMSLPAGKTDPFTPSAIFIAHSGCGFNDGTHGIAFDINTVAASHPVAEYAQLAWGQLLAKAGGSRITVDGNPGVAVTRDGITDVDFYQGQMLVIVTAVHVKAGAALTIANLIASRI